MAPMITASMSTIAWREPSLEQAVASILPQVDWLNVFLQGYDRVPEFLHTSSKIFVVRDISAPESARLGASAKFHWLWQGAVAEGYHFAVDDDIEYPADYVRRCIDKIEALNRRAIVGFHGAIYKPIVRKYFRDRELWRFDKACDADRFVHMLGTGTSAMHTSALRLTRGDFTAANSCDLFLAIAAQRQQVPMLCMARPRGYLRALTTAYDPRAASAAPDYAQRMVELHNSIPEWRVYT
jgi:hypothetical protein